MKKLAFITSSPSKFEEVRRMLINVEQLDIDLPEIQSSEGRAVIKAKLDIARNHFDGELIAEDTGLYMDCLNGLPGPLIKWFINEIGTEGLAEKVARLGTTKAKAITWIGYAYANSNGDKVTHYFSGEMEGIIVPPRGMFGFGWDAIFQPDGYDKTFAEMKPEEKDAISMRNIAIEKFQKFRESLVQ
jgi:inosine triphosphate pyrophosphatase